MKKHEVILKDGTRVWVLPNELTLTQEDVDKALTILKENYEADIKAYGNISTGIPVAKKD